MGFVLGMVLGFVVGLVLVVLFVRSENSRSLTRSQLAAAVAAFAKMTVDDSRKILPAKNYPSWVVITQRQKLTWLNRELTKIWPFVNTAASELIQSSVGETLDQYKSMVLASLKFSKFTLGTVAPQFTGIWIKDENNDGITMELEMQWDGNPNIVLDIQTTIGLSLPNIQVKNVGFTGVIRLVFGPLVEQTPCFGAVCVSLIEKKYLDFALKIMGGDLASTPGISNAIEVQLFLILFCFFFPMFLQITLQETIHNALEASVMWPAKQIVPIIPADYSYLEMKTVGTLMVRLVRARNLTNKDIIGKSDPFARLYVRPLPDRMATSKIIDNDLNPIWNDSFEFTVEDPSTQHLTVKVYDHEGVQAPELIGCAMVQLKDLQPNKHTDLWLNLVKDLAIQRDKKNRGQVHLELCFRPLGMESEFTSPFSNQKFSMTSLEKALKSGENGVVAGGFDHITSHKRKDVIIRGVLSVTVLSADDLPPADISGKADPYVVLKMKKTENKNKTRVVNESLNPAWNQTFDFVVENGLHDMLILEVWDHDTFGKDYMGRCIMTLTRVIMEGEFEDSFSLEDAKSGKLNLRLKWTARPIFRDS